ncbi:hypothetical protein CSA08_04280 [Candidatus Gracilibacteria bacterium]|nr:MAG: hypothetical protein CSA08_04280 [Candidatus Gracilibacteria bacterium]
MLKKILDIVMKGLIALTFILALITIFKPDIVVSFIKWIEGIIHLIGYWNYVIIFLSGLIEGFPVLGVVVPGQNILMIVGGFFGNISKVNLFYTVLIASIGAIISNGIGYILGRYYGEGFFKKYGLWFGIGETEVKYLKKGIKKWGASGIILGKFHNLARAFVPFIAGTMKMDKKIFWIYNVIGSVLRSVVIIFLGVFFAEYYEEILRYFGYILTGTMIIGGIYIWKFKKKEFLVYMEDKNKEIELKIGKK